MNLFQTDPALYFFVFSKEGDPVDPILERYHALEEKVASYTPNLDTKRLFDAFTYADAAHNGQLRKSGEPYIIHPLAVAEIVADLGLDVDSVIAAASRSAHSFFFIAFPPLFVCFMTNFILKGAIVVQSRGFFIF